MARGIAEGCAEDKGEEGEEAEAKGKEGEYITHILLTAALVMVGSRICTIVELVGP